MNFWTRPMYFSQKNMYDYEYNILGEVKNYTARTWLNYEYQTVFDMAVSTCLYWGHAVAFTAVAQSETGYGLVRLTDCLWEDRRWSWSVWIHWNTCRALCPKQTPARTSPPLTTRLCKDKRQYLLTCKVSRYFARHNNENPFFQDRFSYSVLIVTPLREIVFLFHVKQYLDFTYVKSKYFLFM